MEGIPSPNNFQALELEATSGACKLGLLWALAIEPPIFWSMRTNIICCFSSDLCGGFVAGGVVETMKFRDHPFPDLRGSRIDHRLREEATVLDG